MKRATLVVIAALGLLVVMELTLRFIFWIEELFLEAINILF